MRHGKNDDHFDDIDAAASSNAANAHHPRSSSVVADAIALLDQGHLDKDPACSPYADELRSLLKLRDELASTNTRMEEEVAALEKLEKRYSFTGMQHEYGTELVVISLVMIAALVFMIFKFLCTLKHAVDFIQLRRRLYATMDRFPAAFRRNYPELSAVAANFDWGTPITVIVVLGFCWTLILHSLLFGSYSAETQMRDQKKMDKIGAMSWFDRHVTEHMWYMGKIVFDWVKSTIGADRIGMIFYSFLVMLAVLGVHWALFFWVQSLRSSEKMREQDAKKRLRDVRKALDVQIKRDSNPTTRDASPAAVMPPSSSSSSPALAEAAAAAAATPARSTASSASPSSRPRPLEFL